MGAYSFLSNPAMVQGRAEDKVLRLYAESDMVRGLVNKPAILSELVAAAPAALGLLRAEVTVGKAPGSPDRGERDALDDLLAFGGFDNITIQD